MSNKPTNKPTFHVFVVREPGGGKKPVWTRLGAAWPHEKGSGLSLRLEAVPVNFDGRLVLMPPKEDDSVEASENGDGE